MVIVTKNQYVLAHKIHHITMDQQISYQDVKIANNKYKTVKDVYYNITILYVPETNVNNNNRDEVRECNVIIRGAVDAHKVFSSLIEQIREQMTDSLYLDKALENMLSTVDVKSLEIKDKSEGDKDDKYESSRESTKSKVKPKIIRKKKTRK